MVLLLPCPTRLLAWALLLLSSPTKAEGTCGAPNSRLYASLKSGKIKDSYPVGTVLQYKCIPGYENIPRVTPSIQCLDNSKWSETLRFCQRSGNTIFAIGQLTLILAILVLIV
ncbi:complement decay-accelerating factor-like [Varanus komodoensis]|uniref:complement decay-accelerating factor-like n=1 Tax=Varanus komodoensis TaxID=61221 RepID=UPI001CF7D58D|nr:complement decay-accelerating factor-like [Varanus komodoensis]